MKNSNALYNKCKRSEDPERIEEIIGILREELERNKTTVGISANQLGYDESISIIRANKEIILINPEIVSHSEDTFLFHEGCLSFPNTLVKTRRFKRVVVKSDNNDIMEFIFKEFDDLGNLELACVQHEIDHLNGITMFDRKE